MSDKSMPAQPVIPNDMPLEAENEVVLKSDFITDNNMLNNFFILLQNRANYYSQR